MKIQQFIDIIKNQFLAIGTFFKTQSNQKLDSYSLAKPASKSSTKKYPQEFLDKAQQMLNFGMLPDFLELLTHNYQAPKAQIQQWSKLLLAEIKSDNTELIEKLIEKKYQFSDTEMWALYEVNTTKYNFQPSVRNKITKDFALYSHLFLDNLTQELKSIDYNMPDIAYDPRYPSLAGESVVKKVKALTPFFEKLKFMWSFNLNDKDSVEKFLMIVNAFDEKMKFHYGDHMQKHSFFSSMVEYVKVLGNLKNNVIQKLRSFEDNKNSLSDMTEFLKNQNFDATLLNTTQELRIKQIKTVEKLPAHIQQVVDNISKSYKTVSNSKDPQIAFETKNVVEQSVPQLLAAYLAFPPEYRNTFKNSEQQTPETLLLVGLGHQLEILQGFEHNLLLEKSQKMEVLNQYGHNKKMSLGK